MPLGRPAWPVDPIADKVRLRPCFPGTVGAGPARDSRAGRAPTGGMAWVGQRRSGSYPRSASKPPAIGDKVRSYGEGIPCFPATCRSGLRPRSRRQGRCSAEHGDGYRFAPPILRRAPRLGCVGQRRSGQRRITANGHTPYVPCGRGFLRANSPLQVSAVQGGTHGHLRPTLRWPLHPATSR